MVPTPLTNFEPVSYTMSVQKLIQSSSKSCALDPLPTNILKLTLDNLVDCITCIINDSHIFGIVPSCFKNAIVTPVIKQNLDQNVLKNDRPVSNLLFISKILEKVVASHF